MPMHTQTLFSTSQDHVDLLREIMVAKSPLLSSNHNSPQIDNLDKNTALAVDPGSKPKLKLPRTLVPKPGFNLGYRLRLRTSDPPEKSQNLDFKKR